MEGKHFLKKVRILWILLAAALTVCPLKVMAGGNGSHINVDRTDTSNVLIIGDSRVVGMNETVGKVSYNATVGGHHQKLDSWLSGKWRHKPLVIAASKHKDANYYRQMVAIVENSLKKWNSCVIVIASSINDIGFVNWVTKARTRMTWLGKKLASVTVKVNGKTVKPVVYYLAMVPEQGHYKTKYLGHTVLDFNRSLQRAVGGTRYIGMGSINNWNNLYYDGSHFNAQGSQHYYDLVISKIRRSRVIIDSLKVP